MKSPQPNVFDPANARECCRASARAYSTPADASHVVIADHATSTRVVITRDDTDIIMAFRGTADLRNWLTDLDCQKVQDPFGPGKIHRGFYEALHSVWRQVFGGLPCRHGASIWFTGHSLGGALAMLAASWLADEAKHDESLPRPSGVYTFGQPRLGDRAFCQAYDADLKPFTWRVVHGDDVIARIPWLLGRFLHSGHEVMFYDRVEGDYEIDLSWSVKLVCDIPVAWRELLHGKLALLAEHHVLTYQALFPSEGVLV